MNVFPLKHPERRSCGHKEMTPQRLAEYLTGHESLGHLKASTKTTYDREIHIKVKHKQFGC